MSGPPHPTAGRALGLALVLGLAGAWLRARLASVYYGHEEEDWGNLHIIRGVLDSGFQWVETEHMPLYTLLSAYLTLPTGDAEVASEGLAVVMGGLTVGLVAWIGARWLSLRAGLVAALLVAVQPESLLYGASPLRESTYTALLLAGIALFGAGRRPGAAVALAAAFLTRFNVAFTILPALLLVAAAELRAAREPARRPEALRRGAGTLGVAAALGAVVALWARYYRAEVGTWVFWGGVLRRNTGDAVADLSGREHVLAVVEAVAGLAFSVLPTHVGWLVLPAAAYGAVRVLRGDAADRPASRWLLLCGVATVGLLFVTAAVSAYEPGHNLYWKWLAPTVPFFALFAAHGVIELLPRLRGPRPAVPVLAALLFAAVTAGGYQAELRRQIERSDRWYGTQVRLCAWIEDALPEDAGILAEGIPTSYLQRVRSKRRLFSWFDERMEGEGPEAFAAWLRAQRVDLVIWMKEDWTNAPARAPFLAPGRAVSAGGLELVPVAREDGYGFIAYRVDGVEGRARPRRPVPADAGGLP